MKNYLYSAGMGLQKYSITSHRTVWSVLKKTSTFEPVCTKGRIFVGSRDGLYAIDAIHGKTLWSIDTGKTLYSPIVTGNSLYVTSLDGSIKKLDADTGKTLWKKQVKGWLYPAAVFRSLVVVGGKGRTLYAFDVSDGKLLWTKMINQELVYRPLAANAKLLIITTYKPEVIAININDSKVLWTRKHVSAAYTAVVDDKQIIYGDQDGVIYNVNLQNGKEAWRRQLRGVIRSSPTLSSVYPNTVWIGTEAGHLVSLNKNNGKILWEKQLNISIVHSPFPLANKIYFKAESRRLMFELFSITKAIKKTATFQ